MKPLLLSPQSAKQIQALDAVYRHSKAGRLRQREYVRGHVRDNQQAEQLAAYQSSTNTYTVVRRVSKSILALCWRLRAY